MSSLAEKLSSLSAHVVSGRPVSEAALIDTIVAAGFRERILTFERARYLGFLKEIGEACAEPALATWRSVPEAVVRGKRDVLNAIADDSDHLVEVSALQFARDIGVSTGAFLACGAAFACAVKGGYSRSACVRYGWPRLLTRPRLIVPMMRIAKRIELHTNVRLINDFSESAWVRMYMTVADALSFELVFDSVVTTAWYLDPAVSAISPRLAYQNRVPREGGAMIIPLPSTDMDTANALKRSPTRRALYERGEYRPRPALMFWRREDLARWAGTHSLRGRI